MVDEVAHEEHAAERAAEVQILDAGLDLLGALDELEHLGVEVDRDDAPPERDQRMRDATGTCSQLQDLGVLGHLAIDEFRLVGGLEQPIQIDRRAWVAHESSVPDGRTASLSR